MIRPMNNFIVRFFIFFAVVFGAIFLLVWFYLSVTSPVEAAELPQPEAAQQTVTFEKGRVRLLSPYGAHDIEVEIAKDFYQLQQGLMYRKELAPNTGMLFKYKHSQTVRMWMKNTYISLDMIFADKLGRIKYIAENTTPLSEDLIQAPGLIKYVLEVPAGTVKRLSVSVGQRFTF